MLSKGLGHQTGDSHTQIGRLGCLSMVLVVGGVPSTNLEGLMTRGPFLESPENFSGPKSHSENYDLLIL